MPTLFTMSVKTIRVPPHVIVAYGKQLINLLRRFTFTMHSYILSCFPQLPACTNVDSTVKSYHLPTTGKSPGWPNGPRQASTPHASILPSALRSRNHIPVLGRKNTDSP